MRKYKRKELGLTPLMLLGAGFALTVTVVVSFILAIISSLTKDPTALTGAFSLVALILSGAIPHGNSLCRLFFSHVYFPCL